MSVPSEQEGPSHRPGEVQLDFADETHTRHAARVAGDYLRLGKPSTQALEPYIQSQCFRRKHLLGMTVYLVWRYRAPGTCGADQGIRFSIERHTP